MMHDFVSDWKKWTRTERVLALIVTVTLLALPLSFLLGTKAGI